LRRARTSVWRFFERTADYREATAGTHPHARLHGNGARKHRNRGKLDPDISLQRIVDSAIDLADTEGLTAVSMRRIAIELSVATMRCTATCVARTLCAC
jgi:hypothetical protein